MPAPQFSSTQQVATLLDGIEDAAPADEDPDALHAGALFWRAATRTSGSSGSIGMPSAPQRAGSQFRGRDISPGVGHLVFARPGHVTGALVFG